MDILGLAPLLLRHHRGNVREPLLTLLEVAFGVDDYSGSVGDVLCPPLPKWPNIERRQLDLDDYCIRELAATSMDLGEADAMPDSVHPDALIIAVEPTVACPGDSVSLIGQHFGSSRPEGVDAVFPSGAVSPHIAAWSDNLIRAIVPDNAGHGCIALHDTRRESALAGAFHAFAQAAEACLGLPDAFRDAAFGKPVCGDASPRFFSGPPQVVTFTGDGQSGSVDVLAGSAVSLAWHVRGGTSLEIRASGAAPPLVGSLDPERGQTKSAPLNSPRGSSGEWVLVARNKCGESSNSLAVVVRELYAPVERGGGEHIASGTLIVDVATWNLGTFADRPKPPGYEQSQIDRINAANPDILFAQEVYRALPGSPDFDTFTRIQQSTELQHGSWFGYPDQVTPWTPRAERGQAIFSRYPLYGRSGGLVPSRFPTPFPWPFNFYNDALGEYVSAAVDLDGYAIQLRGIHVPHLNVERIPEALWALAPENRSHHRKVYASAVLDGITHLPPLGRCIIGGDMNGDLRDDPAFARWRDVGIEAVFPGRQIDQIMIGGNSLRPASPAHLSRGSTPDAESIHHVPESESDHPLILLHVAVEDATEAWFRTISDWLARNGSSGYRGGFGTLHASIDPYGFEFVLFKSGHVDVIDVPVGEQGAQVRRAWPEYGRPDYGRVVDTRLRFIRAAEWARMHGYEHGFPSFHVTGAANSRAYPTFLVKPGAGERRDVPVGELSLPNPPLGTPMWKWLRGTHDYARRNGFVGGLPTGQSASHGRDHICNVWLYDSDVADLVFLSQLGRHLPNPDRWAV